MRSLSPRLKDQVRKIARSRGLQAAKDYFLSEQGAITRTFYNWIEELSKQEKLKFWHGNHAAGDGDQEISLLQYLSQKFQKKWMPTKKIFSEAARLYLKKPKGFTGSRRYFDRIKQRHIDIVKNLFQNIRNDKNSEKYKNHLNSQYLTQLIFKEGQQQKQIFEIDRNKSSLDLCSFRENNIIKQAGNEQMIGYLELISNCYDQSIYSQDQDQQCGSIIEIGQ